jgi:hypothetical protein
MTQGSGDRDLADAADGTADATAPSDTAVRAERIRILSDELRSTRAELARSNKDLDRTQRELVSLRSRRSVRLALAVTRRLGPVATFGRRVASGSAGNPWRRAKSSEPRKHLRATREQEMRLRARLDALLRPARSTGGPLVSVIVPTRDGLDHLRRLLPALDRLVYRDIEVLIVDNGSTDGTVDWLRRQSFRFPLRIVGDKKNRSYSDANNQGVREARGELLLLLNNDTEPAGDHVLGHMVDRLLDDPSAVAVGARLIYPRRSGPATGPAWKAADLSLQHRGVAFATVDGVQVPVHVGRGEDPLGPEASEAREVQIATAACLLLRRTAFEAVDGLSGGYEYGMEDVDLAL